MTTIGGFVPLVVKAEDLTLPHLYNAAEAFLKTWNWTEYLERFRRPGT